ncbi:MAG: leucyl aminopeptidase family protein [Proteobacteria bacterium]|nr:leucyl aminopeptidase family protein [Pseudomonadota bacterium]
MTIAYDKLLPAIKQQNKVLTAEEYKQYDAVLQIVSKQDKAPHAALFAALAKRRQDKEAIALITLAGGGSVVRLVLTGKESCFERQQKLRKALEALLANAPLSLALDVRNVCVLEDAVYTTLVASAKLPAAAHKEKPPLLTIAGASKKNNHSIATAQANTLARALIQLPPNELPPTKFAAIARQLAKQYGLTTTVYSAAQLQKMGAGAICAAGRAAAEQPPQVVRLSYRPRARQRVALVGKGVCYDTGGVNVKPARYMRGMGKDMAGAAVALATIIAAAVQKLPTGIDAWLVLAENNIAHNAYRPDDVVTAYNGKRIEIVHSDAEGRMLLADTLTLASREKPKLLMSYATLTGTMCTALGERMSGFFANSEKWRERALQAAEASGERLCYFPMPADYKEGLKSEVADILQCSEEGNADHILAALFLNEFIENKPAWLHVDLSAAVCKGGLGAAPGNVTGFGVAWTLALLAQQSNGAAREI